MPPAFSSRGIKTPGKSGQTRGPAAGRARNSLRLPVAASCTPGDGRAANTKVHILEV